MKTFAVYLSLICFMAAAITAGIRQLSPATFSLYIPVILMTAACLLLLIALVQNNRTSV